MRDIFKLFTSQPQGAIEPTEAARRNMRPQLRKRFFKTVEVAEGAGGFAIMLDGKPVKTPARRALAAPSRALAQSIAGEWHAQREVIDPAAMPLTRLANAVIDAVGARSGLVADEIVKYLGSDLVFYRADAPQELVARQAAIWDPVVTFAHDKFGARFVLGQGVVYVAQPREAIEAVAKAIPDDPWKLGALSSITTLTGSALIAVALAHGHLTTEQAWAAAHLDEDWNMQTWGRDDAVLKRREARFAELQAAALVLTLANSAD
ncbi:MAG: ATP12 family chaperone protein [Pseudolabrys sp.]